MSTSSPEIPQPAEPVIRYGVQIVRPIDNIFPRIDNKIPGLDGLIEERHARVGGEVLILNGHELSMSPDVDLRGLRSAIGARDERLGLGRAVICSVVERRPPDLKWDGLMIQASEDNLLDEAGSALDALKNALGRDGPFSGIAYMPEIPVLGVDAPAEMGPTIDEAFEHLGGVTLVLGPALMRPVRYTE